MYYSYVPYVLFFRGRLIVKNTNFSIGSGERKSPEDTILSYHAKIAKHKYIAWLALVCSLATILLIFMVCTIQYLAARPPRCGTCARSSALAIICAIAIHPTGDIDSEGPFGGRPSGGGTVLIKATVQGEVESVHWRA